ncbi:hypothetical protein G9A89_023627 [Geosiphon pyriformis]|nr:hypothetical protein G9A89_023627 [Geosiphon pyriformis]
MENIAINEKQTLYHITKELNGAPQKYTKVVTIETIEKDHSSYRKALFQYFQKDLGISAETTIAEIQQPVESDPEEYEYGSNNPTTAQDKFTVNKKLRILSPTTPLYHQTPQSRIVFNPPPETHWNKLLEEYGSLFGNLTPAASQPEGNMSIWEQPPAQNPIESASFLMEGTTILQPIGSSNKGKQPALALRKHSNM